MKTIQSGEMGIGLNGETFQAILGSCVAVCIHDRKLKIGGIIHYLLPNRSVSHPDLDLHRNPLNFGDLAIELLLKELKRHGSARRDLQVFILGGGRNSAIRSSELQVGPQNILTARAVLRSFGLSIQKELLDLESTFLRFNTATGEVFVERPAIKLTGVTNPMVNLIVIGASTGGVEALRYIFQKLPAQTPPIVIVQHIPATFSGPFSESLNRDSKVRVVEASDGDILRSNTAYIAPGDRQMKLHERNGKLLIQITDDPPVNRFKPSVDYLFHSIAPLAVAKKTKAALLTGMGEDGARGLLALRKAGALTVAQDEKSSVVYGMPKAALELHAAQEVLSLSEIALSLIPDRVRLAG
jgi:chemotaxis response regulator CheB